MSVSILISLIAAASAGTTLASAGNFTDLVVFGDSLSDNGNYYAMYGYPPPPYWEGRFSNGPVWVEQMANHLGLESAAISDRAVAGALTTNVLSLQIRPYLVEKGAADPRALYVYWAGANDLLALLESGGSPERMIARAMHETGAGLLALIASGARHILVVNLPDISLTPLIQETRDDSLIQTVRALTEAYNGALATVLGTLEAATGLDFVEMDSFAFTQETVAEPADKGFRAVDWPALSPDGRVAKDPDHFLFWDGIHPTRRAHSFIMGGVLKELGVRWGDVNGDGVLTQADLHSLALAYGDSTPGTAADMDGDGIVNRADLELLHLVLR